MKKNITSECSMYADDATLHSTAQELRHFVDDSTEQLNKDSLTTLTKTYCNQNDLALNQQNRTHSKLTIMKRITRIQVTVLEITLDTALTWNNRINDLYKNSAL